MAKKQLDVAAITDELAHSAFFPAARSAQGDIAKTPSADSPPLDMQPAHNATSPSPAPLGPVQSTPVAEHSASVQTEGDESAPSTPANPSDAAIRPERSTSPTSSVASKRASEDASTNASMLAGHHESQRERSNPSGNARSTRPSLSTRPGPADPRDPSQTAERVIEEIRRCVKQVGKEVSFVRLTPEEKRQLADIAYTYKSQGIKTSENEISRVGINWILDDYHANRANSVLAKVLAALNA